MKNVVIYTDGACSGNPGEGGWGAILRYEGNEKELSGYEEETTNNRMELTAAVKALEALKEPCSVELYSDSSYLVNAFDKKWIDRWKLKGWINQSKDEVKNIDIWKKLDKLNQIHKIEWKKVKGHSDNEYNIRCDKLATEMIKNNRTAAEEEKKSE